MKLGFIGCGNMASAMMKGIIANGIIEAQDIIGADVFAPSIEKAKEELGIVIGNSNREVATWAEVVVLSVKPQFYPDVISEIKDCIRENQIVVTLAPGKTLAWLEEQFGKKIKLIRTMPNTPAMVLEGMTAACSNAYVTEEELESVCDILRGFGDVEVVPEKMIDAVVAVSGSSPAYVFMMIEAMADAAVADGITSTTLMMSVLKNLTNPENLNYYIPSRFEEGYGLNKDAIDYIASCGCDLLITVDCGSVSYDEVEHAKSYGISLITAHRNKRSA